MLRYIIVIPLSRFSLFSISQDYYVLDLTTVTNIYLKMLSIWRIFNDEWKDYLEYAFVYLLFQQPLLEYNLMIYCIFLWLNKPHVILRQGVNFYGWPYFSSIAFFLISLAWSLFSSDQFVRIKRFPPPSFLATLRHLLMHKLWDSISRAHFHSFSTSRCTVLSAYFCILRHY
jgi:hypothetical protein